MREWFEKLEEIDQDCVERYEELLGRKLDSREEYAEIDKQVDEMILEWDDKESFFKAYPDLKKYCQIGEKEMSKKKEVLETMRYVTLSDGTCMDDELLIFQTNAPVELLKNLEQESCQVYIDGGDYEDVPIWREVLTAKGYKFELIDSYQHVTAYRTSEDWLECHEIGAKISEHYVIENQPELNKESENRLDTLIQNAEKKVAEQCGSDKAMSVILTR